MPYKQLGLDAIIVERIRSRLTSLDNLRRTAERLGKGGSPHIRSHAKNTFDEVTKLAAEYADNPTVIRWCNKVVEYTKQHSLFPESEEVQNGEQTKAGGPPI